MASVRFEPRDIWVGLFWDRRGDGTHFYLCPVPCVVVHWVRPREVARGESVTYQRITPEQRQARRQRVRDSIARADQKHPSRLDQWDRRIRAAGTTAFGAKGDGVTDDTEAFRKRGE